MQNLKTISRDNFYTQLDIGIPTIQNDLSSLDNALRNSATLYMIKHKSIKKNTTKRKKTISKAKQLNTVKVSQSLEPQKHPLCPQVPRCHKKTFFRKLS